jgi:hypothetical protein
MDIRFLPFSVAAGVLMALLIAYMIRIGMDAFRRGASAFGLAMVIGGAIMGWATMVAGFGH